MTEGYKKIFWGALLVSFSMVGESVMLLIALIGWVILVYGLGDIDKKSLFGDFSKLRLQAIRFAAVSVIGGVMYQLDNIL